MEQLYFYVFDVIMLFHISLPSWPHISTLCTAVDHERFSIFGVDHWAPKVWPPVFRGLQVAKKGLSNVIKVQPKTVYGEVNV
jgi:hypothetical protein